MDENLNLNGNTEIEKALKEFEAKNPEQIQKALEASKTPDVPKMVQLVMKWTGFKEQKQAEYILLGFVILAIGISLFLFLGGDINMGQNKSPVYPIYKYQEDLPPTVRETLPKEVLDKIPYKYGK